LALGLYRQALKYFEDSKEEEEGDIEIFTIFPDWYLFGFNKFQ